MRRHRQIAILGYPGVGKSSLAHHFVYKQYHDEYDPNIKTNLQYQCDINGREYDLTIIDNAGSDQYTINHSDLENSDAYILVYAIDDKQSFQMVSKIREKIFSTSPITKIPIVLVGNKIDRTDERVVSNEEGQTLANKWKIQFIETSAMDFKNVEEIFSKSFKSMDNIDIVDNHSNSNSNPFNDFIEQKSFSSRTKNSSTNKSCSIS
ncbi:hypothetical protein I4U23_027670 [Adineta vaga]|nr:hypothetical protein I4U23_027670 [Adineta vaga]